MHQKSFIDIKLFTLHEAVKVSYTFMIKSHFTAKKLTKKSKQLYVEDIS